MAAPLLLASGSACLMPPPVEEIPAPTNQPPRILPQNLAPAPTYPTVTVPAACPDRQTFEASLTDPDGDTIYWRVFVDYFANIDREPDVTEATPEADESEPIFFTVEAESLGPSTLHTVELYVADRPFAAGQLANQGRTLEDTDGLVDTFVWTIETDESRDGLCLE